jgi:hypothetical protein
MKMIDDANAIIVLSAEEVERMRDAVRMSLTISDHYLSKISKIPERWVTVENVRRNREILFEILGLLDGSASDAAPDIHTNPICVEYADCIHRIAAAVRRGHMEHAQRMIDELRELEAEHPVEVAAFEAHYNKEGAR